MTLQNATRSHAAEPNFTPLPSGLLQRKCAACGTHTPGGGTCTNCADEDKGPKLQKKLSIGASNDPLEAEADRVADQVLARSPAPGVAQAPLRIQRLSSQADPGGGTAPASVHRTLAGSGAPLEGGARRDMESRFGHDFSGVRVHSDGAAAQSARDVSANAYTVGNNIVFGAGQYAPGSGAGQRLLAHELTHVVQQGGQGNAADLQRKPAEKTKPKANANPKPAKPKKVPRKSRKVPDNWITKIDLDVGAHTLKITWNDPATAPAESAGAHKISPGAGLCCKNCDDVTTSQTNGSLCTPKGGEWKITAKADVLSGHPTAKNPVFFQRSGIAIHSGNLSSPPQSHGCARTDEGISELIHDNVKLNETTVASSGTWAGTEGWKGPGKKDKKVKRSEVCDGFTRKPDPPKKAPAKKAPAKGKGSKPKAAAANAVQLGEDQFALLPQEMAGEDTLLADVETQDQAMDGPGPNNGPAAQGSVPPLDTSFDDEEVGEFAVEEMESQNEAEAV